MQVTTTGFSLYLRGGAIPFSFNLETYSSGVSRLSSLSLVKSGNSTFRIFLDLALRHCPSRPMGYGLMPRASRAAVAWNSLDGNARHGLNLGNNILEPLWSAKVLAKTNGVSAESENHMRLPISTWTFISFFFSATAQERCVRCVFV